MVTNFATDAQPNTSEQRERPKRNILRSITLFLIGFALSLVFVHFLRAYVITPFTIPSESMEPTLMVGDCLFGQKVDIDPQVGDIVTFPNPELSKNTFVKRVIATEGQTIDFKDSNLIVDGEIVHTPQAVGKNEPLKGHGVNLDADIAYPYTVPDGHIWVMGDNREHSSDSRYFGAIDANRVSSELIVRYAPLDRIGLLGVGDM